MKHGSNEIGSAFSRTETQPTRHSGNFSGPQPAGRTTLGVQLGDIDLGEVGLVIQRGRQCLSGRSTIHSLIGVSARLESSVAVLPY